MESLSELENRIVYKILMNFNPALEGGLTTMEVSMTKEEVVSAGVAAVQAAEVSALTEQFGVAFEAGKASVEIPTDLAELQAKLVEAQGTIAKVTSDDEADKAEIAKAHSQLEAIKAILVPPAPAVPVVDAPAENQESTGTDAQP